MFVCKKKTGKLSHPDFFLLPSIFLIESCPDFDRVSQHEKMFASNTIHRYSRMGQTISQLWEATLGKLASIKESRILMVGLDAAGKTTVLYKLKLGENLTTIPTIGFNVETVQYKNINMTVWDVGGQDRIRVLWRHYYQNSDAVIFVVDSNDEDRFELAREELHHMLNDDALRDAVVLVFANKQDLPNAKSASELTEKLALRELRPHSRQWYIQGCCATSGDGLYEGLDWLSRTLMDRRR